MTKHKKKQSKKHSGSDSFLDVTALSIKKYRKVTNEIAKLSTKQKVAGSLMVLAAGYFYLDKMAPNGRENSLLSNLISFFPKLLPAKAPPAPRPDQDAPADAAASQKSPKTPKSGRSAGVFGKKSAASPDEL